MEAETTRMIVFTVWASALAVLLVTPPGLALAWLLARREWRGKAVVETVVALPLVLPPVATGLLLLLLLGRRGPVGRWLYESLGVEVVFTWRAVVVALGVMSLPLLVRAARVAIEEVPERLEQVARTLGAGEWRVFLTVTLPLARRGLAGGLLLSFARALGEFGATMVLAGNIPGQTATLSMGIYSAVQLGDDATAVRLLVVSVILAFLSVWWSERLLKKGARRL